MGGGGQNLNYSMERSRRWKRGRKKRKKYQKEISQVKLFWTDGCLPCVTLCVTLVISGCCVTRSSELNCSADVLLNICTVFVFVVCSSQLRPFEWRTLELSCDLLHGKKYIVDQIFIMAMQDVINKMKGTALGVAEYLTPVLKVVYTPVDKREGKFLFYTICRFAA